MFSLFEMYHTVGIGGESGWGVMGESMEKIVATITDLVEVNLMKLAEAKNKADSDSSRISPKGGAGIAGRSFESATETSTGGDNSVLRPSQMLGGELDEELDSNSDDMEEIE